MSTEDASDLLFRAVTARRGAPDELASPLDHDDKVEETDENGSSGLASARWMGSSITCRRRPFIWWAGSKRSSSVRRPTKRRPR